MDWRRFIESTFAKSNRFVRVDEKYIGKTIIEKYAPIDRNKETIIEIGYFEDTLIFMHFYNSQTIGFNKLQEKEFFYRYDFTNDKSYGEPGLVFTDLNIQNIEKQLKQGVNGKEVQYYQGVTLIKAEIFRFYNDNKECYPSTIHFKKKRIFEKLKNLFFKKSNSEYIIKEIEFSTIFNGI